MSLEIYAQQIPDVVTQAMNGDRGFDQLEIAAAGMKIIETMLKKNADYGSAIFKPSILLPDADPGIGILIRASDKIARFISLQGKTTPEVDESVADTLADLSAYCILYRIHLARMEGRASERTCR